MEMRKKTCLICKKPRQRLVATFSGQALLYPFLLTKSKSFSLSLLNFRGRNILDTPSTINFWKLLRAVRKKGAPGPAQLHEMQQVAQICLLTASPEIASKTVGRIPCVAGRVCAPLLSQLTGYFVLPPRLAGSSCERLGKRGYWSGAVARDATGPPDMLSRGLSRNCLKDSW